MASFKAQLRVDVSQFVVYSSQFTVHSFFNSQFMVHNPQIFTHRLRLTVYVSQLTVHPSVSTSQTSCSQCTISNTQITSWSISVNSQFTNPQFETPTKIQRNIPSPRSSNLQHSQHPRFQSKTSVRQLHIQRPQSKLLILIAYNQKEQALPTAPLRSALLTITCTFSASWQQPTDTSSWPPQPNLRQQKAICRPTMRICHWNSDDHEKLILTNTNLWQVLTTRRSRLIAPRTLSDMASSPWEQKLSRRTRALVLDCLRLRQTTAQIRIQTHAHILQVTTMTDPNFAIASRNEKHYANEKQKLWLCGLSFHQRTSPGVR